MENTKQQTAVEFAVGDKVYLGDRVGFVKDKYGDSISVGFECSVNFYFTKEGRVLENTPIVLSRYPYLLEMKKIEPKIAMDTPVWYRDHSSRTWYYGYYSRYCDGRHFVFDHSKKSNESSGEMSWDIVTTESPLK